MTEEQAKKVVYGFLDGTVSYKEFMSEYNIHHDDIHNWLQDKVDQCKKAGINITMGTAWRAYDPNDPIALKYNGPLLEDKPYYDDPLDYYLTADKMATTAYNTVFSIVYEIDPSIEYYRKYEDAAVFRIKNVPEYLDSVEIEQSGLFEKIMEEFPETMPKTKRIKAFKEKLKTMFYIEGNKYPHWIQSSEWPLSKTGKPTKFLRQKSALKGEVAYYYFLDMDTNEEIEIMQSY